MTGPDAIDAEEPAGYGEAVTELIGWCRARILAAREAVEDATADLVDDEA
jgi:hypothetical protein